MILIVYFAFIACYWCQLYVAFQCTSQSTEMNQLVQPLCFVDKRIFRHWYSPIWYYSINTPFSWLKSSTTSFHQNLGHSYSNWHVLGLSAFNKKLNLENARCWTRLGCRIAKFPFDLFRLMPIFFSFPVHGSFFQIIFFLILGQ